MIFGISGKGVNEKGETVTVKGVGKNLVCDYMKDIAKDYNVVELAFANDLKKIVGDMYLIDSEFFNQREEKVYN